MGLQDREYYRDGATDEFTLESMSVVVRIIVISVAVLVVDLLFGNGQGLVNSYLAVSEATLSKPWLWYQFLTAGFAHADPWHLFFNMLGLYFFGRELEFHFGKKEFTAFYLAAIIFGNLVWAVHQAVAPAVAPAGPPSVLGASGGVMAVVILFCLRFPMSLIRVFFVEVRAWMVGIFYVVINLAGMMNAGPVGPQVAYDVHLAGALFAAAYWHFEWRLSALADFPLVRRFMQWFRRLRGPSLRLHRPHEDDDFEERTTSYETEADRLLEKIHLTGEASLTAKERKFLEDYSRRVRNRLK